MTGASERVLCPKCETPLQMSFSADDYWCPRCKTYIPYGEEVVNYSVSHTFHDDAEDPDMIRGN